MTRIMLTTLCFVVLGAITHAERAPIPPELRALIRQALAGELVT